MYKPSSHLKLDSKRPELEKKCQGAVQETELVFLLINRPIESMCVSGQLLHRSTSIATVARHASLHRQAKNSVSFPLGLEPCYHDSCSAWLLQPAASGTAQMQNKKLQNQTHSWESWRRNNFVYKTGVRHSGTLKMSFQIKSCQQSSHFFLSRSSWNHAEERGRFFMSATK